MNLLVVGGAGFVGSIIRPALEAEYRCVYYDRQPVTGVRDRSISADVNDDEEVRRAIAGQDAVLYLAMGSVGGSQKDPSQVDAAFDVNVKGLYRFLSQSLTTGIAWFGYVSSMSVYRNSAPSSSPALSERDPPDACETYALTKRAGERLCEAFAAAFPAATILSLRLAHPVDEAGWAEWIDRYAADVPLSTRGYPALGPIDNRRLFASALRFKQPGYYALNIVGAHDPGRFDLSKVKQLLGWEPTQRERRE